MRTPFLCLLIIAATLATAQAAPLTLQRLSTADAPLFAYQFHAQGSILGTPTSPPRHPDDVWRSSIPIQFTNLGAVWGDDGLGGRRSGIAVSGTIRLPPEMNALQGHTLSNGIHLTINAIAVDASGRLIWSACSNASPSNLSRLPRPGEEFDFCFGASILSQAHTTPPPGLRVALLAHSYALSNTAALVPEDIPNRNSLTPNDIAFGYTEISNIHPVTGGETIQWAMVHAIDREGFGIRTIGVRHPTNVPPPGITLANYNRLRTGMTYREVVNILGLEGTVTSAYDFAAIGSIPAESHRDYEWESHGTHISASFTNNRLTYKYFFDF